VRQSVPAVAGSRDSLPPVLVATCFASPPGWIWIWRGFTSSAFGMLILSTPSSNEAFAWSPCTRIGTWMERLKEP
jgi:hypothetical protein